MDNLGPLIGNSDYGNPNFSCRFSMDELGPPPGTNCLAGDYWSSSEISFDSRDYAWCEKFDNGAAWTFPCLQNSKATRHNVRCIREFK